MDVFDAIYNRESIRKFTPKDITDKELRKIIEAGIQAPSACNIQGWRFIIIKNKKIKEKIINAGATQIIRNSPRGVMVLYNNRTDNIEYQDHIQSASAAIQNMLLAAHSLNIGSCWICNLPTKKRLRKILKIPKHYDPIAYIMLGYPHGKVQKKSPKNKYENIVSKERFTKKEKINTIRNIKLGIKRTCRKMYHKLPYKKLIKHLVDKKFEKKF